LSEGIESETGMYVVCETVIADDTEQAVRGESLKNSNFVCMVLIAASILFFFFLAKHSCWK